MVALNLFTKVYNYVICLMDVFTKVYNYVICLMDVYTLVHLCDTSQERTLAGTKIALHFPRLSVCLSTAITSYIIESLQCICLVPTSTVEAIGTLQAQSEHEVRIATHFF